MDHKPRCLVTVLTLLGLGLGIAATTKADIIISTPAGLVAGDTFRIAFETDATTEATSTDINYYNTFVNNDATTEAGGGANVVSYDGMTLTFAAIASTATTSAVSNIGEDGVPVYLSTGTLVSPSDTATGLWSGSLTNAIDGTDLTGQLNGTLAAWSGTTMSGQPAGDPLGGGPVAEIGNASQAGAGWIQYNVAPTATVSISLYGISQLLTVPAAVPEPSSIFLAMIGLGAAITYSNVNRRWKS